MPAGQPCLCSAWRSLIHFLSSKLMSTANDQSHPRRLYGVFYPSGGLGDRFSGLFDVDPQTSGLSEFTFGNFYANSSPLTSGTSWFFRAWERPSGLGLGHPSYQGLFQAEFIRSSSPPFGLHAEFKPHSSTVSVYDQALPTSPHRHVNCPPASSAFSYLISFDSSAELVTDATHLCSTFWVRPYYEPQFEWLFHRWGAIPVRASDRDRPTLQDFLSAIYDYYNTAIGDNETDEILRRAGGAGLRYAQMTVQRLNGALNARVGLQRDGAHSDEFIRLDLLGGKMHYNGLLAVDADRAFNSTRIALNKFRD
ncbi:hypothetical protein FISHEDRAFT_58059 [Fistulina hepatica ATCC 64428]|uniref:DUF6699 domain-containing protein n=1 Tax=Fistulina hepatica ATCC 64428 TaxID=1128425 RepID=A0A0D7AG54_9AGAR|nr:hypothetical protein FISHEDRAFT_58059 [Fistulina hepatica ATCC 64428]